MRLYARSCSFNETYETHLWHAVRDTTSICNAAELNLETLTEQPPPDREYCWRCHDMCRSKLLRED